VLCSFPLSFASKVSILSFLCLSIPFPIVSRVVGGLLGAVGQN